MDLKLQQRTE